MSQEGDAGLGRIVSRIASVSRALSKRGRELTQDERDRLMKAAHEVLVTLEEETGKILAAVDRRKD